MESDSCIFRSGVMFLDMPRLLVVRRILEGDDKSVLLRLSVDDVLCIESESERFLSDLDLAIKAARLFRVADDDNTLPGDDFVLCMEDDKERLRSDLDFLSAPSKFRSDLDFCTAKAARLLTNLGLFDDPPDLDEDDMIEEVRIRLRSDTDLANPMAARSAEGDRFE